MHRSHRRRHVGRSNGQMQNRDSPGCMDHEVCIRHQPAEYQRGLNDNYIQ